MKFLRSKIFIIVGLSVCINMLSSCRLMFPNRMFKQGNYEYFSVGRETLDQYSIQKGDLLTLQIFSREGFDLIDVLPNETGGGASVASQRAIATGDNGGVSNANQQNQITFLVEQDGYVELPLFGRTYVLGKTENELEDYIEDRCKAIFNEPYAILKVVNRRAFVFLGNNASVVSLNQGPTTIIEVIAKSGGITTDLKAFKIKVLRGDLSNPEIIDVDLSTMEGLKNANLIVQTNDVIYVEQRFRFVNGVLREVTPVLSLIATTTAVIAIIKN